MSAAGGLIQSTKRFFSTNWEGIVAATIPFVVAEPISNLFRFIYHAFTAPFKWVFHKLTGKKKDHPVAAKHTASSMPKPLLNVISPAPAFSGTAAMYSPNAMVTPYGQWNTAPITSSVYRSYGGPSIQV